MSQPGRIRLRPKLKPEPDLDQIVLAILCMLDDENGVTPAPIRRAPAPLTQRKAS